jgi:ABC-2 type transport system ATP-binding protein
MQRLGLARALLHDPELLILDEPANGLDPAGVVEVRELLASLARERGVTVFMSSHILTEVDRLATRIGIIHQGRLIEELAAEKLETMRLRRLIVQTRDLESAQRALTQAGFTAFVSDSSIVLTETHAIDAPDAVATLLVNAGAPPIRLALEQEDLERHFLRLTEEKP